MATAMDYEQAKAVWRGSNPPRHLLSVADLNPSTAGAILQLAHGMKRAAQAGNELFRFTRPAALALIFEKPSLRTRVTLEVGLHQ
ncbi:MAG: hypothetical protein NZ874_07380, partial [Fimbriimonadales bacterium]|nr:hypothetical protein [Fimbriimonadales bacterium]